MGIFSSIKNAIFGKKEAPAKPAAPAPKAAPASPAKPTAPASPTPISEVDVTARLDAMEGADKLNWRTSIVDLMKLIGVDSSFANRKELAGELGDADYSGTADENIRLHRKTMQELAKNGGKVPAEFLD
jgi:3-oxoacyl-ACP reductase-like protein